MKTLEEEMQMWKENSNKNFAKTFEKIDNEFKLVIAPEWDEYGIEYTPVSRLRTYWVMEENADDKMIEYVARLLVVLGSYDFITVKPDRLIIEDETLKSLINKLRKISSFKKEHINETIRIYNL